MGVVTRAYSEIDGQVAEASSINRVIDDLYTVQAGNLDSANLAASGVASINLKDASVITRTIADGAVTTDKISPDIVLFVQAFS